MVDLRIVTVTLVSGEQIVGKEDQFGFGVFWLTLLEGGKVTRAFPWHRVHEVRFD